MDSARAATADHGDYGLSFTEAVRDCLQPGIITVNSQRRITGFNVHAERFTNCRAAEVLHQPLERLPAEIRPVIEKVLTSGQSLEGEEISVATGTLNASAFPLGKAAAEGVTLVLNDLSPVQKLEGNMRQLDRLASVGALSASMAHEIKNAMVAVRTFVDVLVQENKSADLADIVSREMRRIDSIVGQMLRLAGPAKPTLASIRIHAVLDHALHLVQHQLEAKNLTARCAFNARVDLIHGDEYQLQQAFLNLFFNAIEALHPGGELRLKTELLSNPRAILVSVADNGSGIAPENLGKLFDAFFTTKQHGTGLGLPITRRIIEEHKGSVTVESEPNQGTTFHVTLPL